MRTAYESEDLSSSWSDGGETQVEFYFRELSEAGRPRLLARQMRSERTLRPGVRGNERLSTREREVLVLIARGQSNKRAAQTLMITPETIKSHLKRVFVKLGAKTRAEAVARAVDLGQLVGVIAPAAPEQKSRYF